jgi:hypothetical protein
MRVALMLSLAVLGCSGQPEGNPSVARSFVQITITSQSVNLPPGGSHPFTAVVTGTTDGRVLWSADGGSITADGLYTAPKAEGTWQVTATAAADPAVAANASVVVVSAPEKVTVAITPASVALRAGDKQQFSAAVAGTSDGSVSWSADAGSVDQNGLYTAPAEARTAHVTATSHADPGKSATAVVTVSASTAADPCAGLLPTLPPPRTFTVTAADEGGLWCSGATTDGAGNVYVQGYFYSVRNIAGGGGGGVLFQPLAEGFTAFHHSMSPSTTYSAYAPDGRVISNVPVFAYTTIAGVQANGGTILVGCFPNKAVEARRFDDRGAFTTVPLTDQECLSAEGASVLVDQQDRTLIVRTLDAPTAGMPSGHYAARWFDAAGLPLTGWFDAGRKTGYYYVALAAPIGGGALLSVGVDGGGVEWRALASGTATVEPAPAFLRNRGFAIVRGGKAYAVFSSRDRQSLSLEIFTPGGKSCGTLTANGVSNIGKDGTLIGQTGDAMANNDCVTTWYPQALK